MSPWDGEEGFESELPVFGALVKVTGILKRKLARNREEDEDAYPPGLYLWKTLTEAKEYAEGLGDPFDVWEILSCPTLKRDPLVKGSAYTTERVPAQQCRAVLHVPGDNEEEFLEWTGVKVPFLDIPLSADEASIARREIGGKSAPVVNEPIVGTWAEERE